MKLTGVATERGEFSLLDVRRIELNADEDPTEEIAPEPSDADG